MTENEYRCAVCFEVFEKGLSDEEAIAEHFGGPNKHIPLAECELVCDGCYEKMMKSGVFDNVN